MIKLLISIAIVADVTCAESGHSWNDAELVAGVIRNRAVANGIDLEAVALAEHQFAKGCSLIGRSNDLSWRHFDIAVRAVFGVLETPEWFDGSVQWFCAERGSVGCSRWRRPESWAKAMRIELAGESLSNGRVVHKYWRRNR